MKPFKNKLAVTIVVLSVAFLGIITFSIKSNSTIISSGVGGVISPLQKIVYVVNEKVKESFEFFINFSNVKKENEELSAKNAELENKLVEYDRMKEENTRLREIFNYAQANTNYDYLGCNIIGYSGGNISNGYIIDKGLNHGVEKDMVVITSVGLVGKVTKASSNFSIVQTILNENIAVAAMVESTNETTGILQGINDNKNKNLTQLSNIPMDSAIKEGDIILTSGLGSMYPKGIRIGEVTSVEVDNYYDNTKMKITLDPKLDPKANAQKYYQKYQKAKNSINVLLEQIDLTEKEIEYFDSLITAMSQATYYDALEIKEELENEGYLKKKKQRNTIRKKKIPQFQKYLTKDGIEIDIGKNNLQNDYLTFKYAHRYDMWFHAKDMPGSHVIVKAQDLDEYTIRLAAKIAAYYSKGKNSSSVPVNYTLVKTLKKPAGSKPGKVILDNYKTIYIDPDDEFLQELTKK